MPTNVQGLRVKNRRSHARRAPGLQSVVNLLCAATLFVVLACAPPPAQNQNATPAPTPAAMPAPAPTPGPQADNVVGDITVTPFRHASLQLEHAGKVILVDPTSEGDYSAVKPADLILVTHSHSDHFNTKAIENHRKAGAPVVGPAEVAKKFKGMTTIANKQSMTFAGILVEAVPMYNLQNGRAARYHRLGIWSGYVLTLGTRRVYVAGDTECAPEIQALKSIDVAFVPMNLPYTMSPAAAAQCVKAFKPKVVFPYHYFNADTGTYQNRDEFKAALAGEPVEVRLLDWYPAKPTGGNNR